MVNMRYIIMCGGNYDKWKTPKQMVEVCGEELVARTIRLLRENGIEDISISTHNPIFKKYNVPILKHKNEYVVENGEIVSVGWYNGFYPTDSPTCYIFGDVFFSPEAIKTIVETKTDDIEFFGSKEPFANDYIKPYAEPFALKVTNTKHLKEAIEKTRELDAQGKFWRKPIMWEVWTIIKNAPLQTRDGEYTADYIAINDYTCDIDGEKEIKKMKERLGDIEMIKCEVIEPFTLERFNELQNIERKGVDTPGKLNVGDTFECGEELANYLNGGNEKGKVVVKVIEVIPPKVKKATVKVDTMVKEVIKEDKIEKSKTTKKKKTSKK